MATDKDATWKQFRQTVNMTARELDVGDTAWRYSLMNWGHDPTRA